MIGNLPRPVFFVSDSTGITAETLGNALLAQFPGTRFTRHVLPFVDSTERARHTVREIGKTIAAQGRDDGADGDAGTAPIVFLTVRDPEVAAEMESAPGEVIDLLVGHLSRLEQVLDTRRTADPTAYHRVGDPKRYHDRIDAVEYTIEHDDAASLRRIDVADLVIIAPSRCGKTPTAMYLALQHGLRVANYPLTEDDAPGKLPDALAGLTGRIFGLTTTAQRLSQIRGERRPGSGYASLARCRTELRDAENLYRRHGIPFIDSHAMSVEEMASTILATMNLRDT
ncbi:MAG TPA: kinase/pyrophosphorylase [Candidatus Corynebacterium avicola]|uniref:Putative phosphoenolpyruvate synthase regulatory protein n=1 Tax=Candidatus Corynebacterium avicola TaxID=2838527 RepID=A0A9D1RP23_9CORY|nr:kinase/pyrophosphorylase [Candidatus Corynebacterium avicola]